MAGFFVGRRFRREKFVCVGGVRWWGNVAEEDISSQEMVEQERFQANKIFFGRRAILRKGRSEKNVRARKIVECWRRETIIA